MCTAPAWGRGSVQSSAAPPSSAHSCDGPGSSLELVWTASGARPRSAQCLRSIALTMSSSSTSFPSELHLLLKGVIVQERDFRLLIARLRHGRRPESGTAVAGRGPNLTDGTTRIRETVYEAP